LARQTSFCYSPSRLEKGAISREKGPISKKVFVGNLSFDVTREELIEAFSASGKVLDAKVPTDRETGRPRGFAFIEFESEESVPKCVTALNGTSLKGRPLRVSEAEDRPPRPAGAGPRPSGPRPFRPASGEGYRPPAATDAPTFGENRDGRRQKRFGGGSAPGRGQADARAAKPFGKEKGPRRVERRRGRGFDDDD
jgi:RNA recognition motif-containing protein